MSTNTDTATWIPFDVRMPPSKGEPNYGAYILVSNNIQATNEFEKSAHVWLAEKVTKHTKDTILEPTKYDKLNIAEKGEVTALSYLDIYLRHLTHWRPALPEEWVEGRVGRDKKKSKKVNKTS